MNALKRFLLPPQSVGRLRFPKIPLLVAREQYEETIKDELPPRPRVPKGWSLFHAPGSNLIYLDRTIHIEGSRSSEVMRAIAHMEVKVPEKTYRSDTGERTEQQHITFELFVKKPQSDREGGIEFILTSIDSELIIDGMVMHATNAAFHAAQQYSLVDDYGKKLAYRGPYMNELDEDLVDELYDYLDDRGVNNAFADYIMAQAHYTEQEEYVRWLKLFGEFSK